MNSDMARHLAAVGTPQPGSPRAGGPAPGRAVRRLRAPAGRSSCRQRRCPPVHDQPGAMDPFPYRSFSHPMVHATTNGNATNQLTKPDRELDPCEEREGAVKQREQRRLDCVRPRKPKTPT